MSQVRLAAVAFLSAIAVGSAAAQPAASAPGAVQVRVWSFGFAPSPIHLAAGAPVTLQFVNQSGGSHDFTARSFFGNATITAGAAPEGEIELRPHESKTITLIPRAGSYSAHCSHFMHSALGMHADIVVS